MRQVADLLGNRVFWACVFSWALAQAIKVVLHRLIEKKWDLRRFFGLGGMPSSHSSIMSTLAVSAGIMRGFGSLEFVITLVIAMVVMTDASGVRREAGQHARVLNKIINDIMIDNRTISFDTLKELLGHSPFEVAVGALLGVFVAFCVV